MKAAILIPYRPDGGRRDDLLAWTTDRLARLHPDWPIHIGTDSDGPFNRSAAINDAAEQADADVFIVADSDSFVGSGQLVDAVNLAHQTGQMVLAYDRFQYLSRSMSDQVMAGYMGDWFAGSEFNMSGTCSSMIVFPSALFDEFGGCDEGFVGWGGEDIALSHMLQTFGGGLHRIEGEVWHLWHAPAVHTHDDTWPKRCELYAEAAYDVDKMRALIARIKDDPDAT